MEVKKVIIIGGGRSIREEWLNNGLFDKIQNKAEIWGINFAYLTMPYLPTRIVWGDKNFFRHQKQDLIKLAQKGVTLLTKNDAIQYHRVHATEDERQLVKQILIYRANRDWETSIAKEECYMGQHGFTGTYALDVAVKEGYDEIYCLGLDYGTSGQEDKDTHYYQGFIDIKKNVPKDETAFEGVGTTKMFHAPEAARFIEDYKHFAEFSDRIFNVINPNKESNITHLSKITYEEFYKKINCAD